MKYLSILICLLTNWSFAQTIQLGESDTICFGEKVTVLSDSFDSSRITVLDNPTVLSDTTSNIFSDLIDIGFDFQFYNNTYSKLVIGSNGVISFNASSAKGHCAPDPTAKLPNVLSANRNCILGAWMHLKEYPASLKYQLVGTAPNRRFIVYYEKPLVISGWYDSWSMAIVLYETTNQIDVFIRFKELDSYAIQGLTNENGTIATITPGRNFNDEWFIGTDAKRWIPNGPDSYLIQDIPFQMIITTPYHLFWKNGDDFIPFSDSLEVVCEPESDRLIIVAIFEDGFYDNNINYEVLSNNTRVYMPGHVPYFDATNIFCGAGSGMIRAYPAGYPDNLFYWPTLNIHNDTITQLSPGNYPCEFTALHGCMYLDTIPIINETAFTVTTTPASCASKDDGQAVISPGHDYFTYTWTTPVDYYKNDAYKLLPGDYTCFVNSPVGCSDTVKFTIDAVNDFGYSISQQNESCAHLSDGSFSFNYIGGRAPFYAVLDWDSISVQSFDSLSPRIYYLELADSTHACFYQVPITIVGATPLVIAVQPTSTTVGNDGVAGVTVTGGTPPYLYTVNGITQPNGQFEQLATGRYTCIVTDHNNCRDSVIFYVSALSISESKTSALVLFPNPAAGKVAIGGLKQVGPGFKIELISVHGEYIRNMVPDSSGPENDPLTLDISSLESGFYYLRIVNDGDNQLVKLSVIDTGGK